MSLNDTSPPVGEDHEKQGLSIPAVGLDDHVSVGSGSSFEKGEIFSLQSVDPALNAKMHLVNDVEQPL